MPLDDFTPEDYRRFETRWKSDVDLKLDRMVRFMDKSEHFLDQLMVREAEKAAVRRAIIEKSTVALIVGAITGLCILIISGTIAEAQKFVDGVRQIKK